MASFDLGSLYQKLTLDISDFKQKMGEALKMTSQQATAQVRAAATGRNAVDKAEREMQKLREWNEKSRLKAQREADIALAKRVQQELRGQHEISNGWRRSITNFRELIMQYFAVESAIRLVEGAMRKVVDLSRSVISAFSELEDFDSPISIALSQADNHIANTKEGVLEIVMALKLAAAEIGTTTDALLPMVTNMLRAGFAANQSINFAQKMKLLIDSFGQGSVRMTQMWALLRGDLEESGQLAGILGVHVNEIVEAFRRGDLERVLAIFNEKLGVGAETISDVSKEWKSMVATLEATWNNALLKSDAAKNLFNSIKYILEDITQEINTQGQFWRDIESIINAIAFAIRELYWTMKGWSLLIRDIKSFFGADTPEPKLQDKTESILDKPSPKGIQLPKSEKLAKDAITQANQALQDQISLIRETARGAQEIGDAFSKLTLARMQQEMASLGDQERERSAQVRRDLLIEQQAINEQLAALAKLRGEKAQEAQGEIAGLQARREAIGSLLEESRIQTEINLKKIDANRWAEQQVNLLLKANDAIEKQSELEGLQLELEQLKRANSQLLADYTTEDRNNRTEALQAELRRLDVMDRQAGIQAGILNVQFQQNLAATTDKDTQEKLTQEYQRQLELLQAQVDVRGGRRAVIGEQIKGVGLEERRELAETLQSGLMNAATAFIERLKEGVDDIKSLLQDLGSAFIDRFIGRMLDKMVTSLTNTIEKFMSQTFGANGSFVMGLIGALAIGVASLFNNAKAEVRSLGSEISDVSNRTTDSIRGLVIAVQNQSLPVLEIGRSLREALRGTETRLDRANKLLADIASKMGVSVGSDASFYATESLGSSAF